METDLLTKFQKVVDLVAVDISAIRTGRVTSGLIENVVIPVYGGTQNLRIVEVAGITVSDHQTLVLSPWDKSIIGDIRQGILAANIGMNPSIDGEVIRISMPPLTTEDREKYVKLLSGKLENCRVMVRQIRADEIHEIKKKFEAKEITEDEKFAAEKKLQTLTDEFIAKIEAAGETKKQDLLSI